LGASLNFSIEGRRRKKKKKLGIYKMGEKRVQDRHFLFQEQKQKNGFIMGFVCFKNHAFPMIQLTLL